MTPVLTSLPSVARAVHHVLHLDDLGRNAGRLLFDLGPDEPRFTDCVGLTFVLVEFVFRRNDALVEVVKEVDLLSIAEELLVRSKCRSVVSKPLSNALTKLYSLLNLLVGDEVNDDFIRLLTDAIDTARTLDNANDRPGQVVVDDDVRVLQVLAFRENVGRHQHINWFGDLICLTLFAGQAIAVW